MVRVASTALHICRHSSPRHARVSLRMVSLASSRPYLYRTYSSIVLSDPFLAYKSLVQAGHLRSDECQLRAAKELQKLYRRIEDYRPPVDITRKIRQVEKVLKNKSSRNPIRQILTNERDRSLVRQLSWEDELLNIDSPRGLMLSGSVGTGKSMLVDTLLPMKRRWHYNALMLELFHRLNRERDDEFILLKIAYELIDESPILAIDEFQLGDAASARILKGVLIYFWKMGGVLVATSNRMPEDLYSGSFQAEQYKSFTELLATRCVVHDMRSGRDFRRECEEELAYYFSPEHDVASLETLVSTLLPDSQISPTSFNVYGRTVKIPRQAEGVAHFTFAEICEADLGPADYITLASRYHTVIVDAVPVLTLNKKNEARRFISLLDALYEAKCRLIIRAEALPDGLFFPDARSGSLADEVADSIASEAFSETYYDVTQPNRPNVSAYVDQSNEADASLRFSSLRRRPSPNPHMERDDDTPITSTSKLAPAASDYNDMSTDPDLLYRERSFVERRAGSRGEELALDQRGRDFGKMNAFTGADEQFAFRRASSRLHEMTSRTWHDRPVSLHHNRDPDAAGALLRPKLKIDTGVLDRVMEPDLHATTEPPAVQTTSPFRTHPEAPPKFSLEHFWNMVQRGGERKKTDPNDWKR